ncbi:MAG: Maf family protein [archaeon]
MAKIILATTSPYRIQACKDALIEVIPEGSEINEDFKGRPELPDDLVKELAKRKAEVVALNHNSGIIIGLDSLAYFRSQILEKPKSEQEAFDRLKSFSGNKLEFLTGVHLINKNNSPQTALSKVVHSDLYMRNLSDQEITEYLETDPRYKTLALGFCLLYHKSASFVKEIRGDYNSPLRGIPLSVIIEMINSQK